MDIQINTIALNEVNSLLSLMKNFYAIDNYSYNAEIAKKTAIELIENEQLGRLYIIKEKLDYVGYIVLTFGFSFEFKGRDGFIDELYIEEGWRNKGIGKLAMEFIVKQTKQLGLNAIHLQVEPHNKNAYELYRKSGFKKNERILMTKTIS